MSKTSHLGFFGDAEHTFDLAKPELIRELEVLTGSGIGGLVRRVVETRTFHHADLEHTIRLGLIGGGTSPQDAARLGGTYLTAGPIEAAALLALSILGALYFGTDDAAPTDDTATDETAAAAVSGDMSAAITKALLHDSTEAAA